MKLAIMQPYFMPYLGYFQLINSVDRFVIYDNIKYTKKGWINRNRILVNQTDQLITVPIKKDSDYLNIVERNLSNSWIEDKTKMLNTLQSSYRKAPYFEQSFDLISKCLLTYETNLFKFLFNSIRLINEYLGIQTPIVLSSSIDIDHNLKSQHKVISICNNQNASTYINSIGGMELYSKESFAQNGIKLNFIKSNPLKYQQFGEQFIPNLSIVDVLMFNSKEQIQKYLNEYTLI